MKCQYCGSSSEAVENGIFMHPIGAVTSTVCRECGMISLFRTENLKEYRRRNEQAVVVE